MVSLEGNYIYVPITDLSMILGTVYEDSYKAVEEPALYGYYGGVDRGYALQPISENPSGFIQFIFLKKAMNIILTKVEFLQIMNTII